MEKQRNRPYVVCHILSSLDGKIDGEYFKAPELLPVREAMGAIRNRYDCDAVLYGAVTAAEVCADGYIGRLPKASQHYPREDYVAASEVQKYVVAIDVEGRLQWRSKYSERPGRPKSHIIEVLTEDVSDDYLAHLHQVDVSYIFAGKTALDIGLALKKLTNLFNIDTLMISGGGVVDWSFLQAGYIDELSLVLCPLTDGRTDTATVFDRSSYLPENAVVAFSLEDVQKLDGDGLWLKYIPKNIRK